MINFVKSLMLKKHWKDIKGDCTLKDQVSKMSVNVTRLPTNSLIINVPEDGMIVSGMLKNVKNINKSCDKLIITSRNNNVDVYFIEMKCSLDLDEKNIPSVACNQILYTIPEFNYLASMIEIHFQKKYKITKYFTIIAKRRAGRLDKQNVKPRKFRMPLYKSKKFKVIHSSSIIPFNELR